jgi:hypothetical protein
MRRDIACVHITIYYTRELTFAPRSILHVLSACCCCHCRRSRRSILRSNTCNRQAAASWWPETRYVEGCILFIQHDDVRVHACCAKVGFVGSGICTHPSRALRSFLLASLDSATHPPFLTERPFELSSHLRAAFVR